MSSTATTSSGPKPTTTATKPTSAAAATKPEPKQKKTTIEVSENEEDFSPKLAKKFIKILRISLIFFYGQFFANALYTNLIHGIPMVAANPTEVYPKIKVILGSLMLIHTIFAVVVIWFKLWRLIFASAISLIILSITCLITNIVDFVQKNERKQFHDTEFGSTITEIIIETLLRVLAIVASFFMIKFLRDIYKKVPMDESEDDQ